MTLNYFVVYQGMVELGLVLFGVVVVVIAGVVVLFVVVGVAVGVVVVLWLLVWLLVSLSWLCVITRTSWGPVSRRWTSWGRARPWLPGGRPIKQSNHPCSRRLATLPSATLLSLCRSSQVAPSVLIS